MICEQRWSCEIFPVKYKIHLNRSFNREESMSEKIIISLYAWIHLFKQRNPSKSINSIASNSIWRFSLRTNQILVEISISWSSHKLIIFWSTYPTEALILSSFEKFEFSRQATIQKIGHNQNCLLKYRPKKIRYAESINIKVDTNLVDFF